MMRSTAEKKGGGGGGDPKAWTDMIAQATQGWPPHVHSYAKHASEYLQSNSGVMTPDGLNSALEAGHEEPRFITNTA